MESKTFYNESLTEHNVHPYHKHTLEGANMALEGVNPSCGDDIVLLLKVEDDKIDLAGGRTVPGSQNQRDEGAQPGRHCSMEAGL